MRTGTLDREKLFAARLHAARVRPYLATALFASSELGVFSGLGLAEGATVTSQLGVQALGAAATAVWCGALTWVILKIVDAVTGLRVSADEETEGLDIVLHDEQGYNL